MLLLSLLVETGQLPGTGLTQADKTCIQLNFYLEILKGFSLGFQGFLTWVSLGFQGGAKAPPDPPDPPPPPLNATLTAQQSLVHCFIFPIPCTAEDVLKTALSLYMSEDDSPLPTPEELLICYESTSIEEVCITHTS